MADDNVPERPHFNLVDEPWIRVRLLSGGLEELSLKEVFARAGEVEALCNDLPTQDFAILRVLLAILQRSISPALDEEDDPAEVWGRLWEADGLPCDLIDQYLDHWHDRFDLFDEQHPFMQVAGMHKSSGGFDGVTKMIADVPDGTAFFAMRAGTELKSLSHPEAARWLIHLQAYDPSGIKSGVVGDPAVRGGKSYPIGTGWDGQIGGLYACGRTLRETLLLNLVLSAGNDVTELFSEEDLPCWERGAFAPFGGTREPSGRADLYTWQSRRALLHDANSSVSGVLLTNGDKLAAQNRFDVEPMTAWRRSPAQEKKAHSASPIFLPRRHQKERALWRGLDAVLPAMEKGGFFLAPGIVVWLGYLAGAAGGYRLGEGYRFRLRAVGFVYGTKNESLYDESIDDELVLSAFLVAPEGSAADAMVRECLEETDEAVSALGRFAQNLQLAAGDKDTTAAGARDEAKRAAYFELDGLFRRWLAGLEPQSDLPVERAFWRGTVRGVLTDISHRLVAQAGASAHVGRSCKIGSKSQWMTAAKAEALFYGQLHKSLPNEGVSEERTGEEAVVADE